MFSATYQYPDVLSIINEINSLHGSTSMDLNCLLKFTDNFNN